MFMQTWFLFEDLPSLILKLWNFVLIFKILDLNDSEICWLIIIKIRISIDYEDILSKNIDLV